jgi:hypothetical protein
MPGFTKVDSTGISPFGKREYLRSTKNKFHKSYTFAKNAFPSQTIDGNPNQKVLQPGMVLAKITSGADAGKVGVFVKVTGAGTALADGRSDPANIVGLNDTFAPWQLVVRDIEVSVTQRCEAMQGWCSEFTTDSPAAAQPLSNTTAAAMQRGGAAGKSVDIGWH